MRSASDRATTETKNCWPKKKRQKSNKVYPKLGESWINELVGDKRIYRDKPKAWTSSPQIGMDKIRATTNVGKFFVNFASTSTIHGLNHLTAPHRHPFERFLAVIFIGGALVSLILLSLNFWNRYQEEAVISVLDSDYRSFVITKPAIMLCPVLKYDENKFDSVFKRHNIENTQEAREFFAFIANATYNEFKNVPMYDGVSSDKWLTILWELKGDVITDNPDQSSRSWTVTEKGFCLNFYGFASEYASYEYWMEKNWTIVPIPEKIPSYTYQERENVVALNVRTHSVMMSGFHTNDISYFEEKTILIEQRHLSTIEMVPREVKTPDAVNSLSIYQRKCKKIEEGGLKMWPIYTHGMCLLECKYELIRQQCGCYPHFARPMPGIRICTATDLRCVGLHSREYTHVSATKTKLCGCLPNCNTAFYDYSEISNTGLKEGSPMDAVLNIHLEFPVEMVRREVLFGFNDFLTSVGGAAGLFLGASVISFVEIIYHATLRLFWYRHGLQKEKKTKMKMKRLAKRRKNINATLKY